MMSSPFFSSLDLLVDYMTQREDSVLKEYIPFGRNQQVLTNTVTWVLSGVSGCTNEEDRTNLDKGVWGARKEDKGLCECEAGWVGGGGEA